MEARAADVATATRAAICSGGTEAGRWGGTLRPIRSDAVGRSTGSETRVGPMCSAGRSRATKNPARLGLSDEPDDIAAQDSESQHPGEAAFDRFAPARARC